MDQIVRSVILKVNNKENIFSVLINISVYNAYFQIQIIL